MQCPNCRHDENDAATECSHCGLVFAKWQAAKDRAQAGQPARLMDAPRLAAGGFGWTSWIWITLLSATVGVWVLNRWALDNNTEAPAPAFTGKVVPATSGPVSSNSWRFEGRVVDLLRGSPIKGVKVAFIDFETGHSYEDATDDDGHYSVEVEIRWKLGYAAEISHSLYQRRYWAGSALYADRKDRFRMGLESPPTEPDTRAYRGSRKKGPVTFDFALFPQDLSDSERQEAAGL